MGQLYYHSILVISFLFLSVIIADEATSSIEHCPKLEPRDAPAKDALDLRVDDISYIASLGDSLMAGFGMEGYKPGLFSFFDPKTKTEYRGKSFVTGADPGAVTVANFLKYYNPHIGGGSSGVHHVRICRGPCSLLNYKPKVDNLNAARAGARLKNMSSQIDYLKLRFRHFFDYKNKWKMIVLQIGTNDVCNMCKDTEEGRYDFETWFTELEKIITQIKESFPKTVLYILGNFKITNILYKDGRLRTCERGGILKNYDLCPCGNTDERRDSLDQNITAFNDLLHSIADRFTAKPGDEFGVIFSGVPAEQTQLPDEALSNIDCFHPSVTGHEWLAKVVWNDLFTDGTLSNTTFDPQYAVICPLPEQRLQVIGIEEKSGE